MHSVYVPSLSSPPMGVPPSASPPIAASVKRRSRKPRETRQSDARNPKVSPQPTRKSKSRLGLANLTANFTSSQKNRKECNPKKNFPQNSSSDSCSSTSCSSGSSSGTANASYQNILYKPLTKRDSRDQKTSPSALEYCRGYSTSHSYAESPPLPHRDASIRISPVSVAGSSDDPSPLSEVTLSLCNSSLSGQIQGACAASGFPHQQEPISYQLPQYQQEQYQAAEYQQDSIPSLPVMSPSPHPYHKDDCLHNTVTSSLSSSPPLSPASASSPNASPHKFQHFSDLSSTIEDPAHPSARCPSSPEHECRQGLSLEEGSDRLNSSYDLASCPRSLEDFDRRIYSPDDLRERLNSPVENKSISTVSSNNSRGRSSRSIAPLDVIEDECRKSTERLILEPGRRLSDDPPLSEGNVPLRPTNIRDDTTSNRSVNLVADEHLYSRPREVLCHPDHYRIPSETNRNSPFSIERESLPVSSPTNMTDNRSSNNVTNDQRRATEVHANTFPESDSHNDEFSSVEQQGTSVNSNSSISTLYGSCFEKEVI